jgi:hypothetical protein
MRAIIYWTFITDCIIDKVCSFGYSISRDHNYQDYIYVAWSGKKKNGYCRE